jgi:hypothetical protein
MYEFEYTFATYLLIFNFVYTQILRYSLIKFKNHHIMCKNSRALSRNTYAIHEQHRCIQILIIVQSSLSGCILCLFGYSSNVTPLGSARFSASFLGSIGLSLSSGFSFFTLLPFEDDPLFPIFVLLF